LSRCLRLNFAGETEPRFNAAQTAWLATFSETAAVGPKSLLGRYRLLGMLLTRLGELKAGVEKPLTEHSPLERYDDIDPKLREKWEEELTAAIEAEYRRQRTDLLAGLHWWLRDVWLQTGKLGENLLNFPQLKSSVEAIAKRISPKDALENLRVMEQTHRLLYTNVQEALALEVGLLKLQL
jgi:hypothetical protein